MAIPTAVYLLSKGWKNINGEWIDPTGSWPDGMDEDDAARVQRERDRVEAGIDKWLE